MNDGELRAISLLTQSVDALRQDFHAYRDEAREHRDILRGQLAEHSTTDARNFAEIWRRLTPLEAISALARDRFDQQRDDARHERDARTHWKLGWLEVFGLVLAAAAGAALTLIATRGHP